MRCKNFRMFRSPDINGKTETWTILSSGLLNIRDLQLLFSLTGNDSDAYAEHAVPSRWTYALADWGRIRRSILPGAPVRQTEPFTDLDQHIWFLRKTTSF